MMRTIINRFRAFCVRRATVMVVVGSVLCGLLPPLVSTVAAGNITSTYSQNSSLFWPDDVWNYLIYRSDSSLGTQTTNSYVIYASDTSVRTLTIQYDDRFYVNSRVDNDSSSPYHEYGKTGTYRICNSNAKDMAVSVTLPTGTTTFGSSDGTGLLCTQNSVNIGVPSAAFQYDSDTRMYKANFSVSFSSEGYSVTKAKIEYRMSVNSAYLSYAAGGKSAVKRAGAPNAGAVMYFPFGLSCSSGAQVGTVVLYDLDNGNNDTVSGAPAKKAISLRIFKDGSPMSLVGNPEIGIDDDGGAGGWRPDGTFSDSNTRYLPLASSNQNVIVYVAQQPGSRYMLELSGASIHYNNFIQVGLPSPSIYGSDNFSCPQWTMNGYTDMTGYTWISGVPSAVLGQQVTFWHHVVNNGPTNTQQDIWSDTQVSGGGTAKGGHNTGWYAATENKLTDVDTITVPNNASNGTQYCQRVGFQWRAHNDSSYGSGNWACVTVHNQWTMTGYTVMTQPGNGTIPNNGNILPDTQLQFWHHVKNNGPDTTNMDVWSDTQVSGGLGTAIAGHSLGRFTSGQDKDASNNTITIPLSALNGYKYCQTVGYQWTAYNNSAYSTATPACVTVKYDYTLGPVVTRTSTTIAAGEPITFATGVNKATIYYSNPTDLTVRRILIPAGSTLNTAARNTTNVADFNCGYYTKLDPSKITCSDLHTVAAKTFITSGLTSLFNDTESAAATENLLPGDRICYSLTLNSATQAPKNNFVEAIQCTTIVKNPALTVLGGDVRTGGAFRPDSSPVCTLPKTMNTATGAPYSILMHNYNSTTRGSYVQYAALAAGKIDNFGTGGLPYHTTLDESKRLLFATAGYSSSYGSNGFFYGATADTSTQTFCLPDMTTLYAADIASATSTDIASALTVNTLTDLTGLPATPSTTARTYRFTGSNATLTLNAAAVSELTPGKRLILYVNQTTAATNNRIVIANNITYQSADYTSLSDLPQLVIIAEGTINIQISANVEHLSGIYATGGNIYTCDDYDGSSTKKMTKDTCTKPLTVNGALMAAGRVLPYRTYGYDTIKTEDTKPAEVFNLTPATLLRDYKRAESLPMVTTDTVKEVPTRL